MPKSNNTKERIFDAAVDLFAEMGYKHCRLEVIAKRVGIKAASIYHHYESKDAILRDILEYYIYHFNTYRTPPDKIIKAAGTVPLSQLVKMMFYSFGDDDEHEIMMKISKIIIDLNFVDEEVARVYKKCFLDEPMEYITKVFRGLVKSGKIKPFDFELFALQMNSYSYMMFVEELVLKVPRKEVEKLFDKGIAMFARGLENAQLLYAAEEPL